MFLKYVELRKYVHHSQEPRTGEKQVKIIGNMLRAFKIDQMRTFREECEKIPQKRGFQE